MCTLEFEKPANECKFWRISFSAAEKEIMLHADGAHLPHDDGVTAITCRKDVLRLLKDDLLRFNENNKPLSGVPSTEYRVPSRSRRQRALFNSFFLKTTVLQLFEKRHLHGQWTKSDLRERYIEALRMVSRGLDTGCISHYFIKDENLMKLSEFNQSYLQQLAAFFNKQIEQFDSTYRQ